MMGKKNEKDNINSTTKYKLFDEMLFKNKLFKGLRKDNGKEIFGNMIYRRGEVYIEEKVDIPNRVIYYNMASVWPNTVVQYINLDDINENKIFEKDKVRAIDPKTKRVIIGYIKQIGSQYCIVAGDNIYKNIDNFQIEVIGNIIDELK